MHRPNPFSTATLHHIPSLISRSPLRRGFLLMSLAVGLGCLALPRAGQAQLPSPAPDGGYPGGNTAEGDGALQNVSISPPNGGIDNTAIGNNALLNDAGGSSNTAIGADALKSNVVGTGNTATGFHALENNLEGGNTATGWEALQANTGGIENTATGERALLNNTTGENNTATGAAALASNTTGSFNTAAGSALSSNTTGTKNTAIGFEALVLNNTGNNNTATGYEALFNNTGSGNTANGANALLRNTGGSSNTASGLNALRLNTTGNSNTGFGQGALGKNTMGSFNTAIGFNAGSSLTTGHDNVDILAAGVAGESNTMRIGTVKQTSTYITGINGVNEGGTISAVYINSTGQLGTQPPPSSRRFKKAITPMDKASEAILALKPVTFQYKSDDKATPQFGLIAEEVAQVSPDLVLRESDGQVYTVRYEAVNAMLLNEFLKEHRNVAEQQSTIAELKTTVAQQQKQIEALTATVQKVSDQIALSKPAPQLVANP